jgi:hypothetical protein
MKTNNMNNANLNKNTEMNNAAKPNVTKAMADKTAVNNVKKTNTVSGVNCPVDITKDVNYMPPKDENTL